MYSKLRFDLATRKRLRELEGMWKIDYTGKFTPASPRGARDVPWIFIGNDSRNKFCGMWNPTFTRQFGIIPTACRFSCWKVVIKPRNVKETFECYEILLTLNLPSKIGIDKRTYTFGPWAGFVYCNSLRNGRRTHKHVRAHIPEEIPVILKRGCTEMEMLLPSNLWDQMSHADIEKEEYLNDMFAFREERFYQSDWWKSEIKERWIEHAIGIGDPTARETFEKYAADPTAWDRIVAHSVTYHEEEDDDENEAEASSGGHVTKDDVNVKHHNDSE